MKRVSKVVNVGDVFGRLRVVSGEAKLHRKNTFAVFVTCLCECGKEKTIQKHSLLSGSTTSCGCYMKERVAAANTKHGLLRTYEWACWGSMKERCTTNPKDKAHRYYAGRGISVCAEWQTDFIAFLTHIGPAPSSLHTVDRINNDLGYVPGNVRWATKKEQALNRRPQAQNSGWFIKGIQNNKNVAAKQHINALRRAS